MSESVVRVPDPSILPWPAVVLRGDEEQDLAYLFSIQGLKVAILLLNDNWNDPLQKRRFKREQIKIIERTAADYAQRGTITNDQARKLVQVFKRTMRAQLNAPNSVIEVVINE